MRDIRLWPYRRRAVADDGLVHAVVAALDGVELWFAPCGKFTAEMPDLTEPATCLECLMFEAPLFEGVRDA